MSVLSRSEVRATGNDQSAASFRTVRDVFAYWMAKFVGALRACAVRLIREQSSGDLSGERSQVDSKPSGGVRNSRGFMARKLWMLGFAAATPRGKSVRVLLSSTLYLVMRTPGIELVLPYVRAIIHSFEWMTIKMADLVTHKAGGIAQKRIFAATKERLFCRRIQWWKFIMLFLRVPGGLMRRLSLCLVMILLMIFVVVPPAIGACLDWEHDIGAPSHSLQYAGTLGDRPIRMKLHLDIATRRIDGAYGYNNQPGVLQLTGELRPDGEGADLIEHDQQGRETGRFDLRFYRPRWPGETRDPPPGCDNLTGQWHPAKDAKQLDVALHSSGESNPVYDQVQQLNESTAYKLRQAMLDGNRAAFASLLQYPFHSQRGLGVISVWNNPQDVVKHYKHIMLFPEKAIRDAVPHFLEGGGARSQFMNRSVYIDDGKVTWICEGACPVVP